MTQQRVSPITLTSQMPAVTTLSLQGAVGQSANLVEVKNSTGTVLLAINSAGQIAPSAVASVGLVIKGLASQSGDLQQWQSSAGTVLASVSSAGNIALTSTFGIFSAPQPSLRNTSSGGAIYFDSGSGGTAGSFIFRTGSGLINVLTITGAGTINFVTGNTSATATAGAVTAPALVVGFITMQVAGTTVKVPYYSN